MMMEQTSEIMEPDIETPENEWRIRVADIKQYAYCPRVVFYEYCLPGVRPLTYKMQHGLEAQSRVEELEKRRSLREYRLTEGVRHFHVALTSERLGCTALIDLVVESGDGSQRRVDACRLQNEPSRAGATLSAAVGLLWANVGGSLGGAGA
ncbi:hypothetical protein [Caldilinea sp.]|uniref:CRISPR-associated protein Cas4 n=1 Tax=Caldilinea sp. TaxID=2293560 RepID=UPI0021DE09C3|nr:hypothetical protein [Caldilinea sp.]GIV67758.1 MAG: hypothetical protein KatS3mg048_0620 [Caldilinea sp.]